DVRRLRRELENLAESLEQLRLRTKAPATKLPRASRLLEEFAATNRLNLLLPEHRELAAAYCASVLEHAPVLRMSFAAEPSRTFTTRLIVWLRSNLTDDVLLEIGLEPTIAAGCILRTPRKQYDFSLRARFEAQAGLLAQKLHAVEESAHVG
ncbi:MAG TPA: hypothetical protein VFH39_03415, partial [Candidatus Saccharimonadales bacterium]|nr:hypothetical protein [Candidatus Saccharimonadales bacterium]